MALCPVSNSLGYSLSRHAARLSALGAPGVAQALSGFVGDLPPLSPSGGSGALNRSQTEAFAGLYYYAELEELSLIGLAELLVEERYSLNINDHSLFQALEDLARMIDQGWYDQARRKAIFQSMLGFGTARDMRRELSAVVAALMRFDQARYAGNTPYSEAAAVGFAFDAMLRRLAGAGGLGLERAAQVLNGQLRAALAVLGNKALHRMFRANDIWGLVRALVVDPSGQTPEPGPGVDRAQSGAAILGWAASRLNEIAARNGSLQAILAHDATLLRNAARWQAAARGLQLAQSAPANPGWGGSGGGAAGYGEYGGGPPGQSGGGWA